MCVVCSGQLYGPACERKFFVRPDRQREKRQFIEFPFFIFLVQIEVNCMRSTIKNIVATLPGTRTRHSQTRTHLHTGEK